MRCGFCSFLLVGQNGGGSLFLTGFLLDPDETSGPL